MIEKLFKSSTRQLSDHLFLVLDSDQRENQQHTNDAFSRKWKDIGRIEKDSATDRFQKKWYLDLYGFREESDLALFLQKKKRFSMRGVALAINLRHSPFFGQQTRHARRERY